MALAEIGSAKIFETSERNKFIPEKRETLTAEQGIEFATWNGYYREIPELQGMIDRLALWVVYGGDDTEQAEITFKTKSDEKRFNSFRGYGKDTPEDILYNLFRVGKICGTSMAEIIKIKKRGVTNLKPLDPGSMTIKANEKGFITSFEQTQQKPGADGKINKLRQEIKPENIFYIAWNRIADEIVGISTIEKLKTIIDYRHQAMENLAEVFDRYINPFWVFYVDTDDEDEIDEFNTKIKQIFDKRGKDHLTIPEETVKKHERLGIPQFSTLDPLNWIKHLERYFLMSEGVPEIIGGIGRETADASSRMIWLGWRIITIAHQKIFEKQIKAQLGIDLKLPRPVNILGAEVTGQRSQVPRPNEKNENKKEPNG